jgi:hypothetical protein
MHINSTRHNLFALLAGLLASLAALPAIAQEPPPDLELGKIAGTEMLRDEFRARGLAQLAAIALNALAYYEIEGEYPTDFYALRQSDAWNIDATNMFTGRPVQAVFYEVQEGDLTGAPPLDVIALDIPAAPAPTGTATDPTGSFDPAKMGELLANKPIENISRVDPRKIKDPEPGEVFYYTAGGLLQLVMFAPDGTFTEYVDESPNRSWLGRFRTNAMAATWPDDLFAAEVLFYLEQLLPQYYNLAKFMGDQETTPRPAFTEMGGDELLLLADELGITPLNPVTKKPLALSAELADGDLCEPDPAARNPLHISLPGGRVVALAELRAGANAPDSADQPEEPEAGYTRRGEKADKPKAPPMGGRKN